MELNDLARQSLMIAGQRGFKTDVFHTLKHCAGEVLEAIDAYNQYCRDETLERKSALASELADIIICALSASAEEGIDIERALNEAMQKNARRAYG